MDKFLGYQIGVGFGVDGAEGGGEVDSFDQNHIRTMERNSALSSEGRKGEYKLNVRGERKERKLKERTRHRRRY